MRRRDFIKGGAIVPLLPLVPAWAQDNYPSRTVRLIVPTPAGGTYDLMGRLFMDRIGPSLGTAIVENRAGGNALVGVTAAAQAAPDGYTLVLGSNATHIIQTVMMRNPPYDPVKQFVPVSTLSAAWSCIAVAPKLGINTLAELIDYGRKNPGRLSAGHRGIGDSSHMSAELLKKLQPGFTMQYIPYSAMAQAVRDLISGDLDMTATLITRNLVELHEAGKIKLLAVSAPQRIGIAPDIPTAIEAGTPNMIAAQFFYLFAPAGTPAPIVQKLNDLSRTALTDATFKAKLESAGFDPHFAGGLEETRKFYEAERALWVPLAEASGEKTN